MAVNIYSEMLIIASYSMGMIMARIIVCRGMIGAFKKHELIQFINLRYLIK
jgi:hypothetical protein